MFTMNVLHKDQEDLISDQKAYLDVVKDIKDRAGKDFEKKYPKYQQGGLVNYTGLAMVHGSDRHPEIMFDNIQVDRMERLLTNAERNAGGRGNDFSTQNMNTVNTTNTKTVIAAPLRHLFGEHEARMVSATVGVHG